MVQSKLDFKPAVMNAQNVYLAEPYKVEHYDYSWVNGITILKPCYAAYYRIYNKHAKVMMFGNSCEHDTNGYTKFYDTKEEAFEACQRHYNKTLEAVK